MYTVSILGCGWLGLPLGQQLIKAGYQVKGSTRSSESFSKIESKGIEAFCVNINNLEQVNPAFFKCNTIIIAITSKDLNGFHHLLSKIKASSVQNVLFISSTSVYPMTNGIVTEQTETIDSALVSIENLFRNESSLNTTIIRFAGLYGPGRDPGNFLKLDKKISNPEAPINLIHQEDCIAVILGILNKNVWNQIFNTCSDEHPTRREYYTKETLRARGKTPIFDEESESQFKIIDSSKIRKELDYSFKHKLRID